MVVVMRREFDRYDRIIVSAPCLLVEHPRALLLIAITSLGNKNSISSMILRQDCLNRGKVYQSVLVRRCKTSHGHCEQRSLQPATHPAVIFKGTNVLRLLC